MAVCIVRGTGDVGSAIAHALFCAGHTVALHDDAAPAHPRRGMAFVDAMFDGLARLDGVLAKLARDPHDLAWMVRCRHAIPVSRDEFERTLEEVRPEVSVDARMRKRQAPACQRGLAPLTIGLGPTSSPETPPMFVVETAWGDDLGRVIRAARPSKVNRGHSLERGASATSIPRRTLCSAQRGPSVRHSDRNGLWRGPEAQVARTSRFAYLSDAADALLTALSSAFADSSRLQLSMLVDHLEPVHAAGCPVQVVTHGFPHRFVAPLQQRPDGLR